MSTMITSDTAEQMKLHKATPNFLGILRGELFKITRQWTTWITLIVFIAALSLPHLIFSVAPNAKLHIQTNPLNYYYQQMDVHLSVLRVFSGFFLMILTARVFGLEYQLGTIRIILARGVGRLQLLAAKLLTAIIAGLVILVGGILYTLSLEIIRISIVMGNLDSFNALTSQFWADSRIYILTVAISMGVTILLAMAMSILGRSLTFGLSFALCFFPADNISTVFLILANRLTNNDFWLNISAYLLGPNINALPTLFLPDHARSIGSQPLIVIDTTHALIVALVYAVIFTVVAIVLMWRRDVKE